MEGKHPGVVLMVKFKSGLTYEEAEKRYKERLPEFQALPGLIQKYYLHNPETGEWAGMYLWDSQESLEAYLASELRGTIAETYEVVGEPRVDRMAVVDVLRPER